MIRLDKLLVSLGLCTRSRAKIWATKRIITEEGARIIGASTKVDPDKVLIDGQPLSLTKPLHLALHKPADYVCTRDARDGKIVYDLIPSVFMKRRPALSIAGRLDKESTGLVLLSQSGDIVNRIITPKNNPLGKKVYTVTCQDPFDGKEAEVFKSGSLNLRSESTPCKPADWEVLNEKENKGRLTLYEGRYHQVRRMFGAIGNKVTGLHRTQVGPVHLGDLPEGKWRHLTPEELTEIMDSSERMDSEKHVKVIAVDDDTEDITANELIEEEHEHEEEEEDGDEDIANETDEKMAKRTKRKQDNFYDIDFLRRTFPEEFEVLLRDLQEIDRSDCSPLVSSLKERKKRTAALRKKVAHEREPKSRGQ